MAKVSLIKIATAEKTDTVAAINEAIRCLEGRSSLLLFIVSFNFSLEMLLNSAKTSFDETEVTEGR